MPVAASCEGRPLNKPNDVVFRSDGTMYFTDPGAWPNHTPGAPLYENFVYGVTPDGRVFEAAPFEYPNGLAFSPDESTLYVTNTRHHKHISAYDVSPDGALTNRRVFAELPQHGEPGVPDGIKVDVEGRTYCTGPGGVFVHGPDGHYIGKIRLPRAPRQPRMGRPRQQDPLRHRPHLRLQDAYEGRGHPDADGNLVLNPRYPQHPVRPEPVEGQWELSNSYPLSRRGRGDRVRVIPPAPSTQHPAPNPPPPPLRSPRPLR